MALATGNPQWVARDSGWTDAGFGGNDSSAVPRERFGMLPIRNSSAPPLAITLVILTILSIVPPTHWAFAANCAAGEIVRAAAIVNPRFNEPVGVHAEAAHQLFVR